LPARILAEHLGLPIVGTLGILLAAKRKALIPSIRPLVDTLRSGGFRIAPDLYEETLVKAGERRDDQDPQPAA
jgi:hypothetical protein